MAAQALYRKWRSQRFDEIVGQAHVTTTLRNALREGRASHAYLFAGPRGTGKTSTARILAKALNCLAEDPAARPCNECSICIAITEGRQLDLIEIDAASNRGIDEIRDLRDRIVFRPSEARYKVYIIDEVHMLTKEAFNALLKTLEEPPSHAILILATTEPDRVPETVRSRCQRFDFRRIPSTEIVGHLTEVLEAEGHRADPEALATIARYATGSMRDALSLLDQLLSYGDEVLAVTRVERVLGLVNGQVIGQLVDCIAASDGAAGLTFLNRLVSDGIDLGQLVDQVLAYLRAVLFVKITRAADVLDLTEDVQATVARQADRLPTEVILAAVQAFVEARAALRDQIPGVPQLPVELALLQAALPAGAAAPMPHAQPAVPDQPRAQETPKPRPVPATTAARETGAATPPAASGAAPKADALAGVGGAQASVAGDGDLLQAARASWDRCLAMAGRRCGMKVQAALRAVREIDLSGQVIVLQFSHAFARDLVGLTENRTQVEALWGEMIGRKVQVRCGLVGEASAPPPASTSRQAIPGPQEEDEAFLQNARELGAVVRRLT